MRSQEQIFRTWNPFDMRNRGVIDDSLSEMSDLIRASRKRQVPRTFLFIRVYLCEIGSHQMISPVENPMMTSMWDAPFVTMLASWHKQCAFVNKIFVK